METRKHIAAEKKRCGTHNCAQAILCTYVKKMMSQFQQRNGATQCKLLKGIGTKVVLRECPDCVADAAEFLEEQLEETV